MENDKLLNILSSSLSALVLVYYSYYFMQNTDYFLPFFLMSLVGLSIAMVTLLSPFLFKRSYIFVILSSFMTIFIQAVTNYLFAPNFGTDEEALVYGASSLLLKGLNPYTANVSYYQHYLQQIPVTWLTPSIHGSYISTYSYMPLEAIFSIPALLLKIRLSSYSTILSLLVIPIIYYAYMNNKKYMGLALVSFTLFDVYVGFSAGGTFDYLWVIFIILTFLFLRKKPFLSSIFLALALAYKQSAWVILPMVLISFYYEYGRKSLRYIIISAILVLAIVLPFLSMDFIRDILVTDNAIPLGLSIPSFLNNYYGFAENVIYVIILWLSLWLVSIALYKKITYGIVAFSFIFYMLYIRGLLGYFFFIILILIAIAPEIKFDSSVKLTKTGLISLLILSLVMITPIVSASLYKQKNSVKILNVNTYDNLEVNDSITSMTLKIYYQGIPQKILLIRVFQATNGYAANGLLWTANNQTLYDGINYVNITPMNYEYILQCRPFYIYIMLQNGTYTYYIKNVTNCNVYPSQTLNTFYINGNVFLANWNIYYYDGYLKFSGILFRNAIAPYFTFVGNGTDGFMISTYINMNMLMHDNYTMNYYFLLNGNTSNIEIVYINGEYLHEGITMVLTDGNTKIMFLTSNVTYPTLENVYNGTFIVEIPYYGQLNLSQIVNDISNYYGITNGQYQLEIYALAQGNFSSILWFNYTK